MPEERKFDYFDAFLNFELSLEVHRFLQHPGFRETQLLTGLTGIQRRPANRYNEVFNAYGLDFIFYQLID